MKKTPPISPFVEVLKHQSYRRYTGARLGLLSGIWMERMAYGWLTWEITHSELWVGALAALEMVIALLITPLGGVMADRLNPVKLMCRCQLLSMLVSVILIFLIAENQLSVLSLFPLILLKSALSAMSQPVGMSMVNNLMGQHQHLLAAAIGLNAIAIHTSRFLGPALGGFIIYTWGVGEVFLFNLLGFSYFCYVLTCKIQLANAGRLPAKSAGMLSDIREGTRYALAHPGIGPILLLASANALFLRAYLDLLPSISDLLFDGGADALSLLSASSGLGGLLGALLISIHTKSEGLAKLTRSAAIFTGIFFVAFASSNTLWLGIGFISLMGVSDVIMSTGLQILVQTSVDDQYRGRVLSLLSLIARVGPAAGAFSLGLLSTWIPLGEGLLYCAIAGLIIVVYLRLQMGWR